MYNKKIQITDYEEMGLLIDIWSHSLFLTYSSQMGNKQQTIQQTENETKEQMKSFCNQ